MAEPITFWVERHIFLQNLPATAALLLLAMKSLCFQLDFPMLAGFFIQFSWVYKLTTFKNKLFIDSSVVLFLMSTSHDAIEGSNLHWKMLFFDLPV